NARAVCAEITEPEDAAAIRNADEPDILLRPVSQNLFDLAAARDRQIHAARLAIDVTELETGFPDRRVINDRQKARRVGHYGPLEQRLIVVEQIDQIDVSIKVGVLVAELHHHPAQLYVQGLGDVGHKADDSERLLFRLAEGGRLVERRIQNQVDSAFAGSHVILLLVVVGLSAHAASAFAGAPAT